MLKFNKEIIRRYDQRPDEEVHFLESWKGAQGLTVRPLGSS